MGKANRTKLDTSRRGKIAAQRVAARRAEQRRRILIASGSILAVIAIVVAFIVIKANSKPASGNSPNGPTGAALSTLVSNVTSVPASTLDKVADGSGQVTVKPKAITGTTPPLTAGGKPEMLYIGAEFCPFCAAERWSMIVALSRFGTFSGLATVHSASVSGNGSSESYPNTPTWTFANAKYTSKYLTFSSVETQTNKPDSTTGGYTNLQTPTSAQEALLAKYDAPPYVSAAEKGSIPFIDFGNKYLIVGASYNPQVLAGLTWSKIGADLSDPNSTVAKAIDGTANYITAAICKVTGNQPASACTATVQSLETQI
jgi:hypothetical protein